MLGESSTVRMLPITCHRYVEDCSAENCSARSLPHRTNQRAERSCEVTATSRSAPADAPRGGCLRGRQQQLDGGYICFVDAGAVDLDPALAPEGITYHLIDTADRSNAAIRRKPHQPLQIPSIVHQVLRPSPSKSRIPQHANHQKRSLRGSIDGYDQQNANAAPRRNTGPEQKPFFNRVALFRVGTGLRDKCTKSFS